MNITLCTISAFYRPRPARLRPIASHLKITADFCRWKDRVVFGCDDTAITGGNRFVNQSQSNLWFRKWERLAECGRPAGWGGVWVHDDVAAETPSLPFHFAGYARRMVHLAHGCDQPVAVHHPVDRRRCRWAVRNDRRAPVIPYHVFPDISSQWVRLGPFARSATYRLLHFARRAALPARRCLLPALDDGGERSSLVRPRGGDLGTLQVLAHRASGQDQRRTPPVYYEVGPDMSFQRPAQPEEQVQFLEQTAGLASADFTVDAASAAITSDGVTYRLPISADAYRQAWSVGWPRGVREVVTERLLLNCGGTFYVLPHKSAAVFGSSGLHPHKRSPISVRGGVLSAGTGPAPRPTATTSGG